MNTLNQRDRDEQLVAMLGAPLYPDSVTRGLKSDAARVWKRHQWVKDAFDKLRSGASPESVIDPRTGKPIDPNAYTAPVRKSAPTTTSAPPPPPPPTASEPPPAEDQPSPPVQNLPPFPEGSTVEDQEALMIAGELIRELMAARAAAIAANRCSPPPSA